MNIKDYNISESLPESIDRDNVREVAKVIDEKLHELDVMTELCNLYPRIDELSSNLIDALAIQLHVDFYDTTLDLENRRALVKNSILWHMKKGTPFAVAGVISAAFDKTEVKEWYEYGGEPYHFKIVTEYVTTEKDKLAQMRRAIESVKNVRSWLDAIEFILHLVDQENPTEEAIYNAIADTIEFYPWIGRYYNGVYSYGGSCQTFDGSWTYDGAHDYDGGSIDETAAPHPLLYDGVSNYDGEYTYTPYGRASPPFIFYNSLEPDMLEAVAAVPELVEQYTACYQYNGGISYDGQTHYGYDKGPQESTDVEHILPQLADAEKESELQEADVTPNIVEMYPYGRTRYYNGAFTYDRMNTYDGSGWYGSEWKYDGAPDAMPSAFETCRFDGTTSYDGTKSYEAPRLAGARYDSDTADDLEDAVKTVDAETVELKEASAVTDDLELSDTYAKNVFDGTLSYGGVATYTTNYLEEAHESIKAASSDQLDHAEAFDGTHAFDGSLTYTGKADGPKDEMSVTLYVGRQYNGLTNYDAGCKDVFDGSLTYDGGKTYAGLRNISFTYSNLAKYDGTRRFARPYESYSVYEISA